jgi:hypothetical protein
MTNPIINGRASICEWELKLSFLDKNQAVDFIHLIMSDEIDFKVYYEKELTQTNEKHNVEVSGYWANNLTRVSKMAKKVDYKDD